MLEITIKGSASTERAGRNNNARSCIFVSRIAFARARSCSLRRQFTRRSIMFSSLALYHSVRHSIKKIQYLCERDLAAFCELARRGLRARDPHARRWKAAPLRVSIFARCSQTRDYQLVDICKRCCRRRDRGRTIVESRCASLAFVIVPRDISASLCTRENVDIPFGGLKSSIAIGINSERDTDKARY